MVEIYFLGGGVVVVTFVLVAKTLASNYCLVLSEQNRNLLFTHEGNEILKITFKPIEIPRTPATLR